MDGNQEAWSVSTVYVQTVMGSLERGPGRQTGRQRTDKKPKNRKQVWLPGQRRGAVVRSDNRRSVRKECLKVVLDATMIWQRVSLEELAKSWLEGTGECNDVD